MIEGHIRNSFRFGGHQEVGNTCCLSIPTCLTKENKGEIKKIKHKAHLILYKKIPNDIKNKFLVYRPDKIPTV